MNVIGCAPVYRLVRNMRKLTLGEIEVENGNLNHTLAHLLVGTANPNITEEELREGYWEHEGLPKPVGCEKE